jgi:hypothetical protein
MGEGHDVLTDQAAGTASTRVISHLACEAGHSQRQRRQVGNDVDGHPPRARKRAPVKGAQAPHNAIEAARGIKFVELIRFDDEVELLADLQARVFRWSSGVRRTSEETDSRRRADERTATHRIGVVATSRLQTRRLQRDGGVGDEGPSPVDRSVPARRPPSSPTATDRMGRRRRGHRRRLPSGLRLSNHGHDAHFFGLCCVCCSLVSATQHTPY